MRERVENINIENAKLMFKNFSGKNDRFNPGRRNFSVIIEDEETALALKMKVGTLRHTSMILKNQ